MTTLSKTYFDFLKDKTFKFHRGMPLKGRAFEAFVHEKRREDHLCPLIPQGDEGQGSLALSFMNHTPHQLEMALTGYLLINKDVSTNDEKLKWNDSRSRELQLNAITRYKDMPKEAFWKPTSVLLSRLREYYDIYSDLFFFGSLKNLCLISIETAGIDCLGETIFGAPDGESVIPQGYAATIKIKARYPEAPGFVNEEIMSHYLETLLHEMLHAFFGIYSCQCSEACKNHFEDIVGQWGHHKAWQYAATVIEYAVFDLLKIEVTMDREIGLVDDWKEEGIPDWFGRDQFKWDLDKVPGSFRDEQRDVALDVDEIYELIRHYGLEIPSQSDDSVSTQR